MLPAMCSQPPCMNIEVNRVSHTGRPVDPHADRVVDVVRSRRAEVSP